MLGTKKQKVRARARYAGDERRRDTRKALQDAALDLLGEGKNFASLSLREITRAVGVVPAAFVRFLETDSQTKLVAKPQLRGAEGQKLTLNLGDEVPVPSTVFTPIAAESNRISTT